MRGLLARAADRGEIRSKFGKGYGYILVEDPLGTAKDMAYNATIGTAEEIIDTAVWGGKMILIPIPERNLPQTSRIRAARLIIWGSRLP